MKLQQSLGTIHLVSRARPKQQGQAAVYQQCLPEHGLSFLNLLLPGPALSNADQSDDEVAGTDAQAWLPCRAPQAASLDEG